MKKTIIALLTLSAAAYAAEYSGDFSWGSNKPLTFIFENEGVPMEIAATSSHAFKAFTANDTNDNNNRTWLTQTYPDKGIYTALSSTYVPARNVGNEGPWELTLKVSNNGSENLKIDSLTLSAFTFNGQGDFNNGVQDIKFSVIQNTISVGSTTASFVSGGSNYGENPTLNDYAIDLDSPITIMQGKTATFIIKAEEAVDRAGTFVGLQGLSFKTSTAAAVPEPTTATLSLLALAGLAARRRRK